MLETGGAVNPDGGGVGAIADDRNHLPKAARSRILDQRIEQLAANSHALHGRIDINGILHSSTIGRARTIGAGIGISGYLSVDFGDEIGVVAFHQQSAALKHHIHAWRIDLEAGAAMQHGIPVDFGNGWNIRLLAGADGKGWKLWEGSFSCPVVIHGIIVHCGSVKIKIICLIQTIRFSLMMDLDLRQVRSFMDVAELGSFSAAADKAGLTQPAISLHPAAGKAARCAADRTGRQARAADGGGPGLSHPCKTDCGRSGACHRYRSPSSQRRDGTPAHRHGRHRLHLSSAASAGQNPPVMPGIDIVVQTGNTHDILRLLEANTIDAAVVALPASGRSLDISDIHLDELVAVFPLGTISDATILNAETLSTQPLLLYEGGNTRKLVDQWFSASGRTVQPAMELGSVEAIKKLAGAGLGLAIVPRMAMEHEGAASGLEWRSLEPPLERRIALALRRDKHMTAPLRALAAALPNLQKR